MLEILKKQIVVALISPRPIAYSGTASTHKCRKLHTFTHIKMYTQILKILLSHPRHRLLFSGKNVCVKITKPHCKLGSNLVLLLGYFVEMRSCCFTESSHRSSILRVLSWTSFENVKSPLYKCVCVCFCVWRRRVGAMCVVYVLVWCVWSFGCAQPAVQGLSLTGWGETKKACVFV